MVTSLIKRCGEVGDGLALDIVLRGASYLFEGHFDLASAESCFEDVSEYSEFGRG